MKISYIFTYMIMAMLSSMLCFSMAGGFINTANAKQMHTYRSEAKTNKVAAPAVKGYIVQRGDSVYKLCHKYKLSQKEFYRINPLHSPTLVAGEEIFVPKTSPARRQIKHETSSAVPKQEIITYINAVANNVVSSPQSKVALINSAKIQAVSMGQTFASSALSSWFSKYGTARISLMSGAQFSSLSPEAQLLLPLYDKAGLLVFTQDGVHSTDGRKQVNVGIGGRYFMGSSMVGLNSFFDHDFSGGHSRLGFGLEYWRDYLKLIANSYLRISNWQQSTSLPGYAARPASGWDLRVNAYLPALPQLGAELGLEKYYGKKVAFAEKSDFFADPYGVTLAVNYTPVPLLTFNAAYKKYQNNKNQMSLGVALNYKLGMALSDQLKSSAVDKMRRLANSRYDLVERNNNIVLEYQKVSDFSLQLSKNIIDVPLLADKKPSFNETLQLSAHSSSGFSALGPDLSFTDDEYKKDGGVIATKNCKLFSNTDAFCDIVVSAPVGEITSRSTKNYLIKLVGKDAKKATAAVEFTIKVTADQKAYRIFKVNPEKVPIKVPPAPQVFYNSSSLIEKTNYVPVKLDLQLLDEHHKPVVGADVAFSLAPAGPKYQDLSSHFKPDKVTETEPGHYVSNLYATAKIFGTLDQVAYKIVPVINTTKDDFLARTVSFIKIIDNIPSGKVGNSQLSVKPSKIPADDTTPAIIKFIAKNAEQEDLPGLLRSLRLVIEGKDKAGHKVLSNLYNYTSLKADGNVYTAELKSKIIADYNIKMQYRRPGSNIYEDIEGLLSVHVEAVAPKADAKQSEFTIDKDIIYDNGDAEYATTISAILRDKNRQLLLNQKNVSFFDELDKLTLSLKEVGNGKYTAKYTSKHVGEHRLYLMPEPEITFKDKEAVLIVEPSIPYGKNLEADATIREANDYENNHKNKATIKLTAIGKRDRIPLRYIENRLRLRITGTHQPGSPEIQAEDKVLTLSQESANTYSATFHKNIAGDYNVQLQYKGPKDINFHDVPGFQIGLKLISSYNVPDYANSIMTFNPTEITIGQPTTIAITINDEYGNRIIDKDINVRVRKNMGDGPVNTPSYDTPVIKDVNHDGIYKGTFRAAAAGQYSFDLLIKGGFNITGIQGQHSIRVTEK